MGIIKLYIVLEVHMTDNRFLKKAIEISRILGIHDRTITRWSLKGEVEKQGRGKYCPWLTSRGGGGNRQT